MAPTNLVQHRTRLRVRPPKAGERFADHAAVYALRVAQHLDECASSSAAQYSLAEQLALILGIEDNEPPATIREMKRLFAAVESPTPKRSGPVFANLRFLSRTLRLTATETALLELAIVLAHHGGLLDVFQQIAPQTRTNVVRKLAFILNLDARSLLEATNQRATLLRLGILGSYEAKDSLDTAVQLPNDVLLALTDQYDNQHQLLDAFVKSSAPTTLTAANFAHLHADLDWLGRYLGKAIEERLSGVNVLFHGKPGTGKTEFAKVLADTVRSRLFEVRYEDREGNPTDGAGRLRAYQLAQACFERSSGALILFDEAEDVFPGAESLSFRDATDGYGKAWMNRLLESNPVPTLWIVNHVDYMDAAYRRRFEYSVEFDTPPRDVRRVIIDKQFAGLPLAHEALQRLADEDAVTPGQVAAAARAARTANVSGDRIAAFVGRSIERSAALLELGPVFSKRQGWQTAIDLSLLNTQVDLAALVERIASQPALAAASWLLYGPSGSGKTAFAQYLGRQLNKQVLAKSAGDLLCAYLGETEQSIRRMFRQAATQHAVLFLDEADSLLTERTRAKNSWEVTQVNELLVQMETFNGIFICATNAVDVLDKAAMRRFTIKIGFGYLKPDQRRRMAHALLPDLSEAELAGLDAALKPFEQLTIGDFVSVKQRMRLLGTGITLDGLTRQLHEELSLKDALVSPAIGFALPQ